MIDFLFLIKTIIELTSFTMWSFSNILVSVMVLELLGFVNCWRKPGSIKCLPLVVWWGCMILFLLGDSWLYLARFYWLQNVCNIEWDTKMIGNAEWVKGVEGGSLVYFRILFWHWGQVTKENWETSRYDSNLVEIQTRISLIQGYNVTTIPACLLFQREHSTYTFQTEIGKWNVVYSSSRDENGKVMRCLL